MPHHSKGNPVSRAVLGFLLVLGLAGNQAAFPGHNQPKSVNTETEANQGFPEPQAEFSEYRKLVHRHLLAYRLPGRTDGQVAMNLPFEITASDDVPYRGKFLLIHGLNDSAYVWVDIAPALADRGFDVRAILLPGHGSHPAEQLDISYQSWLSAARHHLDAWNSGSGPIYLGGFSMGAVIANILALENQQVEGMLLVSPAYRGQLNHLLRWSGLYSKFRPWMFGGMILEDNPIKYNSIPINSLTQYYKTTRYLEHRWGNNILDIPVLMVMTADDSVVDIDYTRKIFKRNFTSGRKNLLVFTNDPDMVAKEKETILPSVYLDRRIINQSHMSLIYSGDNPLFGKNGTQLVCNGNEFHIFFACMAATRHWYGAQHTESPDGVAVARTTYNPDFDTVMYQFDKVFIEP